jgi:hypothetical protein
MKMEYGIKIMEWTWNGKVVESFHAHLYTPLMMMGMVFPECPDTISHSKEYLGP